MRTCLFLAVLFLVLHIPACQGNTKYSPTPEPVVSAVTTAPSGNGSAVESPRTSAPNPERITVSVKVNADNSITVTGELQNGDPSRISEAFLERSTSDLSIEDFLIRCPKTIIPVSMKSGSFTHVDRFTADDTKYFYRLKVKLTGGGILSSSVTSTLTGQRELVPLAKPSLLIDKINYFLEVRDNGKKVKRYPVVFGRDPVKRKLHQDNATTPEGVYSIINVQPNATYYKAYDLNYPNSVDRSRYQFASGIGRIPGNRSIGGEIQIHAGREIRNNWTFGCIALTNKDIDELFTRKEIGVGTQVTIVGWELTRDDLASIYMKRTRDDIVMIQELLKKTGHYSGPIDGSLGAATRRAIGKFQEARKLPVTLQLDARTSSALKNTAQELRRAE